MNTFSASIGRVYLSHSDSTTQVQAQQANTETVASASSPITTTVVLTGTVSATPPPSPILSPANGWLAFGIVFVLCLLIGVLFKWLMDYVTNIQTAYYSAAQALVAKGRTPIPDVVGGVLKAMGVGAAAAAGPTFEIVGSEKVTVGESSEYRVVKTENNQQSDDPVAKSFQSDPADIAAINPKSTALVTLIATRPGAFKLTATASDGTALTKQIAALAPVTDSNAVRVPTFTAGWGILAFAIIIVPIIAVISLAGVLSGEAVVGLLAGLAAGIVPGFVAARGGGGGSASGDGNAS